MTRSEFDYIVKSSKIKSCNRTFNETTLTYFKFDHRCGCSLEGRYVEKPNTYDIMAREGEFTSVKIVEPKDVLVYIKRIFGLWEEEDAKKSTLS